MSSVQGSKIGLRWTMRLSVAPAVQSQGCHRGIACRFVPCQPWCGVPEARAASRNRVGSIHSYSSRATTTTCQPEGATHRSVGDSPWKEGTSRRDPATRRRPSNKQGIFSKTPIRRWYHSRPGTNSRPDLPVERLMVPRVHTERGRRHGRVVCEILPIWT